MTIAAPTEQKLVAALRRLPVHSQGEVLDFAEFLCRRDTRPEMTEPRPIGLCAGEFQVPDDFDAPLPEDVIDRFEAS